MAEGLITELTGVRVGNGLEDDSKPFEIAAQKLRLGLGAASLQAAALDEAEPHDVLPLAESVEVQLDLEGDIG